MKISIGKITLLAIIVIGTILMIAGGGMLYLTYSGLSASETRESFAIGNFLGAAGILSLLLGGSIVVMTGFFMKRRS